MKYLLIILLFSSCAVSNKAPITRQFKVIEVRENTFIAQAGKMRVLFYKSDCDSVYPGKFVTVARGFRVKQKRK